MSETSIQITAWLIGVLLGGFFFAGLWWTLRRGVAARQPALWFLGSSLLRVSIVVFGFYEVSAGEWRRLLLCLAGFVTARALVTTFTRDVSVPPHPTQADHAS